MLQKVLQDRSTDASTPAILDEGDTTRPLVLLAPFQDSESDAPVVLNGNRDIGGRRIGRRPVFCSESERFYGNLSLDRGRMPYVNDPARNGGNSGSPRVPHKAPLFPVEPPRHWLPDRHQPSVTRPL